MPAPATTNHDELLDGLALFDAYQRDDADAVVAVLSHGDAADHLHSVLLVSQMIAHALEASSKHTTGDVVDAIRRQLVHDRERSS